MDTRLILHGGKEVEWVLNQLWVHFRLFLMSFEYTYIPQKLRIQQPKRWIVHCSNEHLKTASTNIINGSSVPWILNILVALINQSQKCHYRKNSLLLYFFFHPISFRESVVLAASRLQKYHFRFIWVYYMEKEIIVRSVLPISCLPLLQWFADDKWHRIVSTVTDTSKLRIQIYNTKTQVFAFPLCTLC